MPCTACMTSYSLLRREQACANCGYGFCPNCLKKTWIFPTLSKKPMNVCSSCFAQLSQAEARIRGKTRTPPANGNWWGDDVLPPPSFRNAAPVVHSGAAFSGRGGGGLRDDVQKAEKAVDRHHTNTDELKARLDNLKENEIQPKKRCLTTQEIEERFAALRGVSVDAIRHPGKMFTESGGRPEESTADLIKRINDERKLEEKWHPDKLLQDRVDRLKDVQVSEEIEEREEPADPGTEAAHPEKQSFGTDLPSTSTRHDDFDIGRELDAVKKVLENCDSSEKPSDPAKNHWKNDEYDLKKIMKDEIPRTG
ncbi:hypothetical protein L596_028512 [Steinernema carpocapsae]|uniref:FYVE-type domain-containing protein n=1 Tax=Steinernema carpocapsae TaxID=34508 RepID=A0A4U5LYN5_STECR|nr:hypothetical protein L596_028512 [Steinernema carpocapsae]